MTKIVFEKRHGKFCMYEYFVVEIGFLPRYLGYIARADKKSKPFLMLYKDMEMIEGNTLQELKKMAIARIAEQADQDWQALRERNKQRKSTAHFKELLIEDKQAKLDRITADFIAWGNSIVGD